LPPSRTNQDEIDQARTIARATFDGFLENDLMPSGMQATAIVWAVAFLVAPAVFLPAQYLAKYPFLRRFHPTMVEGALWSDRMLFILMSAGALGLMSVVVWDTLFPARRDAFVLTPLPVRLSVQMLGRLGGVVSLYLLFAVALNALPAIAFPVVAMPSFVSMPRAMVGHLAATAAADAFVFFGVTSLQGLVILMLGRRAAARVAAIVQAGAVLALLLILLFMTPVRDFTARAVIAGDPSAPGLLLTPLSWFLGLYEFIAGSPRPVMATLALRGAIAGLVPTLTTIAIYAFGYKRLLVRSVETPQRSTRSIVAGVGAGVVRTVFIRNPEQQAIAAFTLRAISRSGRHNMMMAIYVGVALALIMTTLISDFARVGQSALASPIAEWGLRASAPLGVLMAPLMLSAALAVGVRMLITIPAEMDARWVFQTAALSPRRVDGAVHKTLLLVVLPPVLLTASLSAGLLWGPELAVPHSAFTGSMTLLLCELLLIRFRGVPLTRPYVPGRARIHMLWAVYLSAFLTYTYSMADLERELLRHGGTPSVVTASMVFTSIAFALWVWRKLRIRQLEDVPYEAERPDDEMFQGFNLTEAYVAETIASRLGERPHDHRHGPSGNGVGRIVVSSENGAR